MKNLSLFLGLFMPIFCCSQVADSFLDGDFTANPTWEGTSSNFIVNTSSQLQSAANIASTSYLFTPSQAIDDGTWECAVKINYSTSSANYAAVYIVSDKNTITDGCNAYFVKIGDTQDDVSLWLQQGNTKTKIIDGADKRVDKNPLEVKIKVTRDAAGNYKLYSKLPPETEYLLEGEVQNMDVKQSNYFGLMYVNSASTGNAYFFDDILVTGNKALDLDPPLMDVFPLKEGNALTLHFSEAMNISAATFVVDNGIGSPVNISTSDDKTLIYLTFAKNFRRGEMYTLSVNGLTDIAGNALAQTEYIIGIVEKPVEGDVIINEVMFENPEGSLEYLEVYNRSEKILDLSGLIYTTRKTDGSLNAGNAIPTSTTLLPKAYLALCADADSVRNYHLCPAESNIISFSWSSLSNDGATLIIANSAKDTIFDELTYSPKWHHPLVKNPKGVALERIHPDLPTQDAKSWHSAASEVKFGTPGYKNSQYRNIDTVSVLEKTVWAEPEAFSPDNDGVDDICLIHYKTKSNGYVANAMLFNVNGVKVFQLASNVLLSTDGFLSWDGRTDTGKNANVGIYVLYFEMFNALNGDRKQIKIPIVVSTR